MDIEPGKTFKTRAGSNARIYAINGGGTHPIHGAWHNEIDNVWVPCAWDVNGYYIGVGWPRSLDIAEDGIQIPIRA